MQLSVIIPCLNGAGTIKQQLDALSRQKWAGTWEVVVSDNGSNDDSINIIESYRDSLPSLKIIDSFDMQDRAYACNVGVHNSSGDAIVFCDVDDEIADGWIAGMGNALQEYKFVACQHEFEKLNPAWIREAWHPNLKGPGKGAFGFLTTAAGCRIGITRSLFDSVGGFRVPGLRIEDTDLCWRVQLAGEKLQFIPEAVVHYRLRDSFKGTFKQAYQDGISSILLYKRFKSSGMSWRSWKEGIRAWIKWFITLFKVRRKGQLLKCIADLGFLLGHLRGSIKFLSLQGGLQI